MQVGDARLRLRFTRAEGHTDWEVLEARGGACQVRREPRSARPGGALTCAKHL